MVSSDLRSIGVSVFHLLARRRKSLATVARAVHASFELKYGIEKVAASDHPGVSPAELRWRLRLQPIRAEAERTINGMPTNVGSRGAHLFRLRLRVLDEIASAAKEMRDLKTSVAVLGIRAREFNRVDTAMTISRLTEKPLQDFTG